LLRCVIKNIVIIYFYEQDRAEMKYRDDIAIIFDMDGVLVDSKYITIESLLEVINSMGIPAVLDDFLAYVGTGEENMISSVISKYDKKITYTLSIKQKVYETYEKKANANLRPFDGVVELIGYLKKCDIKLAVGSSADKIKVDANIRALGIDKSIFQAIITGEDIKRKKPAPDVFLAAADRVEMEPERCIVIEDATNGIKAAKNAGMKTIAVLTSYSKSAIEAERPDYICDMPSDILSVLKKIILI